MKRVIKNRKIELLDCTLRETPINVFGEKNISITMNSLENAGVDVIEVAFLLDKGIHEYKIGQTHINSIEQARDIIGNKREETIYTVCMNQGQYNVDNLIDSDGMAVDAIRYVLFEGKWDEALNDFRKILDKGYKLFIQHRNIMSYSEKNILEIVDAVNEIKPYAYSMVDTFGSMYGRDIIRFVDLVAGRINDEIVLGFHGHNNHMLANANAELFIELTSNMKHIMVDGTVGGAGIGAGNAHTELLMCYLNKWEGCNYGLEYIYDIFDTVIPDIQKRSEWGYSVLNLISAEHNVVHTHSNYLKEIRPDFTCYEIDKLINEMPDSYKYKDDVKCWESVKPANAVRDCGRAIVDKVFKGRMKHSVYQMYGNIVSIYRNKVRK